MRNAVRMEEKAGQHPGNGKDTQMNQYTGAQEALTQTISTEVTPTEQELLVQWGFTDEEIVALLWLRQWYQIGGSDRAAFIRQLQFLKLLVRSGELEL